MQLARRGEKVEPYHPAASLPNRDYLKGRDTAMHTYTCPSCGKMFHRKAKGYKYCSRDCQGIGKRVERNTCKCCGKDVTRSGLDFCNRDCYDQYRADTVRKREEVFAAARRCKHCDKIIDPTKKQAEFCDHRCKVLFMKAKPRPCINCGTVFIPIKYNRTTKRFVSDKGGKTCSRACQIEWIKKNPERKRKISAAFSGTKHPNWQGGKSAINNDSYRGAGWTAIADKVRKRDGYKCANCGKSEAENKRALDVHRIIPFHNFKTTREANRMSNLVALCVPCHMKEENGEIEKQLLLPYAYHAQQERRKRRAE